MKLAKIAAILLVSTALSCTQTGSGGSGDNNAPNPPSPPTNDNPTVTVDCPSNIGESTTTSCVLFASDPDIPTQTLTCSLNPATTCAGVTLTGCESANVQAQGEAAGPGSCTVVVDVNDDFALPGSGQGSDIITIDEANSPPAWNPPPSNIGIDVGGSYAQNNGRADDNDGPPQTQPLTCSKVNQTCTFPVTVSGSAAGSVDCSINFTAGASESCGVTLQVSDDLGAAVTDTILIDVFNVAECKVYVDDSATGGNNGTSWADAFNVIQDGMDTAVAGCELWVAQGTYQRPIGGREPVLTMKEGVNVHGGFIGTESSLAERGDPILTPSILDGEEQSYHVVVGVRNSLLDGFNITRGKANGLSSDGEGGGMYNNETTLQNMDVRNCRFYNNYAGGGGAIYMTIQTFIDNCIFENNVASSGGAIRMMGIDLNTHVTITNSLFIGNRASWGGAMILVVEAFPFIENCDFVGNYATSGAVINLHRSLPFIHNSIFWGNTGHNFWIYATGLDLEGAQIDYSDFPMSKCTSFGGCIGSNNFVADPAYTNDPDLWDVTTTVGTTNTIIVADSAGYAVNDIIEIGYDNIARTVIASGGGTVTFTPALAAQSTIRTLVENWGPGATDLIEDFHLSPGSPCIDSGDPDPAYNDSDGSRNNLGTYGGP